MILNYRSRLKYKIIFVIIFARFRIIFFDLKFLYIINNVEASINAINHYSKCYNYLLI